MVNVWTYAGESGTTLMTCRIRIGVTERGSFKKYSEAVHIPLFKGFAQHKTTVNMLRIYRAFAEST